jgi:hypothetical protein
VTPRAIAYIATQLVFSLNTSRDWRYEHAGFHYPSFYNFIVDYFEDAEDDISKEANVELLRWWNRYLISPFLTTAPDCLFQEDFPPYNKQDCSLHFTSHISIIEEATTGVTIQACLDGISRKRLGKR